MNWKILVGATMLALVSLPVAANDCQIDIDAIDAYVPSSPLSLEDEIAIKALRDAGAQNCAAGDIAGGQALLAQAKALLGM